MANLFPKLTPKLHIRYLGSHLPLDLLDRGPFAIDFLADIVPVNRLNPTATLTGRLCGRLQMYLRTVLRESRSILAILRIEYPCSDRVLI